MLYKLQSFGYQYLMIKTVKKGILLVIYPFQQLKLYLVDTNLKKKLVKSPCVFTKITLLK